MLSTGPGHDELKLLNMATGYRSVARTSPNTLNMIIVYGAPEPLLIAMKAKSPTADIQPSNFGPPQPFAVLVTCHAMPISSVCAGRAVIEPAVGTANP